MNPTKPYRRPLIEMEPIPAGLSSSGSLQPPIKAVLFDIYGTLFISGSGDISIAEKQSRESDVLRSLLEFFAIEMPPAHLQQRFFAEIETAHGRLRSQGIDYPEVDIVAVWQNVLNWKDREQVKRFALEYEMCVNPVWPMPHLAETLFFCRRNRIRMGIISNAQFYTPYLFTQFLDTDPVSLGFDAQLIYYSYRFGHAKPSRLLFDKARTRLSEQGVDPETIVYVGNDMLNDMLTAHQTGFQTALFAGDQRSLRLRSQHPLCRVLHPDLIVTGLDQLAAHLKRNGG